MANQTAEDAIKVHGTDAQFLIDRLTRERIYHSRYWKELCFGICAADVVGLAAELSYVGGLYSHARKPTPFICLLLKLLQLSPDRDVVEEFLSQRYFKYATVLAATYLRIVGTAVDVYNSLEPLYADYRKLATRDANGNYELTTVDQFVDDLLIQEDVCGVKLPRLQYRHVLCDIGFLRPRISVLPSDDQDDALR